MRSWNLALMVVLCLLANLHGKPAPHDDDDDDDDDNGGDDKLDLAAKAIGVVDQGIDVATKIDKILSDKLDSHFDAVKEAPPNLIEPDAVGEIAKNMKPGSEIVYKEMSGFDGIQEHRPPGWKIVNHDSEPEEEQPESESEDAFSFPMGIGNMLMSGCFGTGYQENDPCYNLAVPLSRCVEQIDAANFIGVGFDVTKSYTSESRKKSVVQRVCYNQAKFADGDVPDNMNAYGIYDYKIGTKSFQSVDGYRAYLADKAGTSMSTGTFAEVSRKFETASSGGAGGLFYNVGGGHGSGSSSSAQYGTQYTDSLQQQSDASSVGTSNHLLAVLEAEIIMYEIALDSSGPSDLSEAFLKDFFKLPTSYYHIGADVLLQDFILRYGTHYVKSAKFGGKLSVFKKIAKDSKMTSEEFARASETEFSAMMSTLQNSYAQTHAKVGIFGMGGQHSSRYQSGVATKTEQTQNARSETNAGRKAEKTSESIETTVEALGGKPEIAAAIMDFYTPAFRSQFVEWLGTISDYPKPFDMTFGRIPELFDINADDLFNEGTPKAGCLDDNLLMTGDGRKYFVQTTTTKAGNKTMTTKKKVFCRDFGKDKDLFIADFKAKRLALERAITIYMSEGPFSTTTFELHAGKKGCEIETLDYRTASINRATTWPDWTSMMKHEFKVIFRLQRALPALKADQEFAVKYFDGDWYFKIPGNHYSIDNTCNTPGGYTDQDHRICVAGMILHYYPTKGLFKFDKKHYDQQNTNFAKLTKSFGNHFIATCELPNVLTNLDENKLGEVPCHVKWTNSHRIDPNANTSCIHFSAASQGDLFVLFSSIPKDHSTWLYLQLSPSGVAFYQQMVLKKRDIGRSIGTLGDKSLFETFFVCVSQPENENIRISYGKSPSNKELGIELSTYQFQHTSREKISFYTFGSGENEVTVDDVRVVKGRPTVTCSAGLIKVGEKCVMECDMECRDTCHQPRDPKSCVDRCRNVKHYYINGNKDKFICLKECPAGFEPINNKKGNAICTPCKEGSYKDSKGNEKCTPCRWGTFAGSTGLLKCIDCRAGTVQPSPGQSSCLKCPEGQHQSKTGQYRCYRCTPGSYNDEKGQPNCKQCRAGTYSDSKGAMHCKMCLKGNYQQYEGRTHCLPCAPGSYQNLPGKANCSACPVGTHQEKSGQELCTKCEKGRFAANTGQLKCKVCPQGTYQDTMGNSMCKACQPGQMCPNVGLTHSETCPANTYSDTERATTCKKCPGDKKSQPNSASCDNNCRPGSFMPGHMSTCMPCSKGSISQQNGASKCTQCQSGYTSDKTRTACVDYDECLTLPKSGCNYRGNCVNTVGSYRCDCTGYTGQHCELDVDECKKSPCQNGGTCLNSKGSYSCKCSDGWIGKHCETDLDECKVKKPCQNNARCSNQDGSYTCTCSAAWSGKNCQDDVDECLGRNPCHNDGTCKNTPGDYTCSCKTGYGGRHCLEVIDKCKIRKTPCEHLCKDGICSCNSGFALNGDKRTCHPSCWAKLYSNDYSKDEDFLGTYTTGCTKSLGPNDHMAASFRVKKGCCVRIYKDSSCQGEQKEFCHDIERYSQFEMLVSSLNVYAAAKSTCPLGYHEKDQSCTDTDECEGTIYCDKNAICTNTWGSYSCQCKDGFKGDGKSCISTDKCVQRGYPCDKNANCEEVELNRYTCSCKNGYYGNGQYCGDRNECKRTNDCDKNAICSNTEGSYSCSCKAGFIGDGKSCKPKVALQPGFTIGNAGGTKCPSGYQLVTDESKCENDAVVYLSKDKGDTGCWKFAGKGCVYTIRDRKIFWNDCDYYTTTATHHSPVCEG